MVGSLLHEVQDNYPRGGRKTVSRVSSAKKTASAVSRKASTVGKKLVHQTTKMGKKAVKKVKRGAKKVVTQVKMAQPKKSIRNGKKLPITRRGALGGKGIRP